MSAARHGGDLERLLGRLRALDARTLRTPALNERLHRLRAWQAARLARTYQDLRHEPGYALAVDFFLSDLYGPGDFTRRNRELSRAFGALRHAFPAAFLTILARAIELEVLTTVLDRGLAMRLAGPLNSASYAIAYGALGRAAARRRQIELTVSIGEELARLVRLRWTALALRAAHLPAQAAGFGVLQGFLERGFAAFRRMQDAQPLLQAIRDRETLLMEALLRGQPALASLLSTEPSVHA
jgi:hypothetical protein